MQPTRHGFNDITGAAAANDEANDCGLRKGGYYMIVGYMRIHDIESLNAEYYRPISKDNSAGACIIIIMSMPIASRMPYI